MSGPCVPFQIYHQRVFSRFVVWLADDCPMTLIARSLDAEFIVVFARRGNQNTYDGLLL